MMAKILKGLLLLGICFSTQAADVTQTFNDAKTWGAQQQTAIPVQINPGTAQAKVPNYQSTSPATNNYGNGNTSLFGLGSSKVSDCSTNPTDPQYSSQECNAVNTVAKSPSQRPQFNFSKSDPIFQAGSSVINDPSQVAGSVSGTYSGCTTKTTTLPATYDTETCDVYHPVQQQTCSKIDNVTVITQSTNCTPGTQIGRASTCIPYYSTTWCQTTTIFCAASPTQYTVSKYISMAGMGCAITGTFAADGVSRSMGSCSASSGGSTLHASASTVASCNGNSCTEGGPVSSGPTVYAKYTPGTTTYTVQDNWEDQCMTFEAAAQ